MSCEWNPDENRLAIVGDAHNTPVAWHLTKGKENIQLCAACASLPKFAKFKKRVPLSSKGIEKP